VWLTGAGEAEEDPLLKSFPATCSPPAGYGSESWPAVFSAEEDRPQGAARSRSLVTGCGSDGSPADEKVIGRAFDVNGDSYTVVGVMPSNFFTLVCIPLSARFPELCLSGNWAIGPPLVWETTTSGIGQLKPGISLQQAEAQMNTVVGAYRADGTTI